MRILIFGGAGFVGLGIAEALLARGDDVTLLDRRAPPEAATSAFADLPGRLSVVAGNVRDEGDVRYAVSDVPDVVIYGAALTADAAREAAEPDRILDVNVGGLVRVLQAVGAGTVRRTILLSSASAYGDSAFQAGPIDETTAPTPRSLYAITKLAGEQFARRLAELGSLDVRIVRLSSVFGPWEHDTGVRDTLSPPFQVASAALEGRPALLPRACVRDFVYVRDVAEGVLALIDAPSPHYDLYNIGPGTAWSLLDWGLQLRDVARPGFECRVCAAGETATINLHGERDRSVLAIGRLSSDLLYKPRYGLIPSAQDYGAWLTRHGQRLMLPSSSA
ncbi:MAG TPA: NAD(P)-dependent oxidoreductase [Vineibacter sp.]|nr:NAD(P)-dependent oxidoreductase [Vineibacter sp.]